MSICLIMQVSVVCQQDGKKNNLHVSMFLSVSPIRETFGDPGGTRNVFSHVAGRRGRGEAGGEAEGHGTGHETWHVARNAWRYDTGVQYGIF